MTQATAIKRQAAPLRHQVAKHIREDILNGVLQPGQRLVESTLCENLGVSRTVIREALRQLESEYLITVLPNIGPTVTVLTELEIKNIYIVRAALEGLAGELFARNATDEQCRDFIGVRDRLDKEYRHGNIETRENIKAEFYQCLLSGAQNDVLTANLKSFHARIAVFRRYAFVDPKRIEPSISELEAIINACARDRDAEAARQACEHHILLAGELAIIEYTQRNSDILKQ